MTAVWCSRSFLSVIYEFCLLRLRHATLRRRAESTSPSNASSRPKQACVASQVFLATRIFCLRPLSDFVEFPSSDLRRALEVRIRVRRERTAPLVENCVWITHSYGLSCISKESYHPSRAVLDAPANPTED
jgi:hypothetical protein